MGDTKNKPGAKSPDEAAYSELENKISKTDKTRSFPDRNSFGNESKPDNFLELLPAVVFTLSPDGRFTFINPVLKTYTGWAPSDLVGRPLLDIVDEHYVAFAVNLLSNLADSEEIHNAELKIRKKVGGHIYSEVSARSELEDGKVVRVLGVLRDITDRKLDEDMLKKKEELYRLLVENSNDLIMETTVDGIYLYVSSNHKDILGYDPAYLIGKNSFDFIHQDDHDEIVAEIIRSMQDISYLGRVSFRYRDSSGNWRWFEGSGALFETSDGLTRAIVDSREITERKKAEEQIQKSLREKESLLREIHHRVKNNLQVISSLLNLQSEYAKNEDSLRLFNESQNRISTIALIHEQLYRSEELAEINMENYIRDLTSNLLTVFEDSCSKVEVNVMAEDIAVNIDTAIPCGLIINELFSNSLKHAFVDPEHEDEHTVANLITVIFQMQEDQLVLMVEDNGVGLPEELNFRDTESLGLQLVCTLTDQIKGNIELYVCNGTCFKITFPAM